MFFQNAGQGPSYAFDLWKRRRRLAEDSEDSTKLKNILTSSSGGKFGDRSSFLVL